MIMTIINSIEHNIESQAIYRIYFIINYKYCIGQKSERIEPIP